MSAPPYVPDLGDAVVRRGRRVRRRRAVAGAVAAVALLGTGSAALVAGPPLDDVAQWAKGGESARGLPRVPVLIDDSRVVDWPGGVERVRVLGPQGAVTSAARVPGGVLLRRDDEQYGEIQLLADDAELPRTLLRTTSATGVAYTDGGQVAAVVQDGTESRVLREVELATGAVRAEIPIDTSFPAGERLSIVGYAGRSVLLSVVEGPASTLLWDPVAGTVVAVSGGSQPRASGPTGLIAVDPLEDPDRCRTTRVFAVARPDAGWSLCEGTGTFSPDGERTYSTGRLGRELVVRDARTGEEQGSFDVDEGLRQFGWEGPGSTLHVTTDEDHTRTLVVRCLVESGRCATAVSFPFVDEIPAPISPVGPG